eukprot:757033-Prymnesium_polylepis.1
MQGKIHDGKSWSTSSAVVPTAAPTATPHTMMPQLTQDGSTAPQLGMLHSGSAYSTKCTMPNGSISLECAVQTDDSKVKAPAAIAAVPSSSVVLLDVDDIGRCPPRLIEGTLPGDADLSRMTTSRRGVRGVCSARGVRGDPLWLLGTPTDFRGTNHLERVLRRVTISNPPSPD